MNFFGHAALAYYEHDDSAFVLGSMLPDFANMIRARPPRAEHEQLTRGIAYHHATDEAFHGTRVFRRLCQESFENLEGSGVRRGTARAVAHVGVELLLDTVLARDARACAAYTGALAQTPEPRLGRHLCWQSAEERERFAHLCGALARRGIDPPDARLEALVWRLSRALAGRSRLELHADDEQRVLRWAKLAEIQVEQQAAELLREVRESLQAQAASRSSPSHE
ncbi:MAG TPA: hypothetical protein VK524_04480 [Polyangiaceae bacterium]|nr:hypothetical protein [Polyangiaceae bacterium]